MRSRSAFAVVVAFGLLIAVLPASQRATAAAGFTDIPVGAYYADAVDWLVDQGITQGTSPTTFSPDVPVTRGQTAAFLWRFGSQYGGVDHGFVDVPGGVYYDTAVGWLLLHAITTGTTPTTFSPGDAVTRAQMAVFLWRYAGRPTPAAPATFTDVPSGTWFTDAVGWLVESGITQGTSPTTYSPDATVTRAQMATFLWRFAGKPLPGDPGVNRDPKLYDCGLQTTIPTTECGALVALYNATNGPSWITSTGWLTDPDVCTWPGVLCTGGVVTDLELPSNQLTGPLPSKLGNLTNLTGLYLSGNQLTGPIPVELGNLTNLTDLWLGYNQLTGPIPTQLGNLTNLTGMALGANQLTGPIPVELGNLTNLNYLAIGSNLLSGVIPPELGKLTNLTWLYLQSNQLTGSVPTQLGNLTNLGGLYLSTNQLSGPVPPNLTNLTVLAVLQLSGQSGCLTAGPSLTSWLAGFDANWNDGCPPPDPPVDCLTQTAIPTIECEALFTFYNATNGPSWTKSIGWLTDPNPCTWLGVSCAGGVVTNLDLTSNQLSGTIPPELGNLTGLTGLSLYSNPLSGPIPPELGTLTNLTDLSLAFNQLSGPIPPELGTLTGLTGLNLAGNDLSGPIPPELGTLTGLTYLGLHQNLLSGTIPPEFGNLTNLADLILFDNQLSGSIPSQLGSLTNLTDLWLYDNQLSGSIPPQLGSLTNLLRLRLINNQLSGPVPPELLNITYLYIVQLSGQSGCLTAADPGFASVLSGWDPLWNDGCPPP